MSRATSVLVSLVLGGASFVACSTGSERAAPQSGSEGPFVFPPDTPYEGGETSDWGTDPGGGGGCLHEFVPVDDAEARTILDNPDEIYGLLERDWVEDLDWLICSPGHCDSTQVHIQFEIQETFRIARREYTESWGGAQVGGAGGSEGGNSEASGSCRDGLGFSLRATLWTDDGQIEGSFEVPRVFVFSGPVFTPAALGGAGTQLEEKPSHAWGTEDPTIVISNIVDLKLFKGEMEIIANPSRPHYSSMGVLMVLSESGSSGALAPHIGYSEGDSTSYGHPAARWGSFHQSFEPGVVRRAGNVTLSEYRGSTEPPEYEYDLVVISSGDFAVTTSINGAEQVFAGTGNQRYSLGHHPPGTEIEAWGVNEGLHLLLVLVSEKDWQVRYECLETGCEARLKKVVPEIPQDAWTAFFPTYIGAVEGAGISETD